MMVVNLAAPVACLRVGTTFFFQSVPTAFSDIMQRSLSYNQIMARFPMGFPLRNHWYYSGQHLPVHNLTATTFFLSASPWNPIPHLLTSQQQLPSACSSLPFGMQVSRFFLSTFSRGTYVHGTILPLPDSQSGYCYYSEKQRLCLACFDTTLPYMKALESHSSSANY